MGGDGGIGRSLDRVDVADIELALAGAAPELGDGFGQAVGILIPELDTCARRDQGLRDAAAEPTGATSDDRMPAGEIMTHAHQPALQEVLVRVIW